MNLDPNLKARIDQLPEALRTLVEAELAAGNSIVEIGGSPAPPVGLAVFLARPVTTRARAHAEGYTFYERNSSSWSGEFTDHRRYYFVLEPPRAPEPMPDMDDIRARLNAAGQQASPAPAPLTPAAASDLSPAERAIRERAATGSHGGAGASSSALDRFRSSMNLDYEKWREGIGYDLEILRTASEAERAEIESLLVNRSVRNWRDVEALAALQTLKAQAALRRALDEGDVEVRLAVLRYAPESVPSERFTEVLVDALGKAVIFGGLTAALDLVSQHHPPAVEAALWRGVLEREGDVATHFAAMLLFLRGQASTPLDWSQRPFWLRFKTEDREARRAAFRELCSRVGEDPELRLGSNQAKDMDGGQGSA